MKPHKWAKEIKAWADGHEIEYKANDVGGWHQWHEEMGWYNFRQYRIKPHPKEPQYLYLFGEVGGTISYRKERHGFQYMGTYIGKIKLENESD